MDVHVVPILSDNYAFIVHDRESHCAAVIDPGAARPVLQRLESLEASASAILITHHHHDHVAGIPDIRSTFPQAVVYGAAIDQGRIPEQQVFLHEGDVVCLGKTRATVITVPGHTLGHIAYYFAPQELSPEGDLFCGDTIFGGGCGRLFEGTPSQMLASLEKIKRLPDCTRIWFAHEYTTRNLEFGATIEPYNSRTAARLAAAKMQQQTVPSSLADEMATNPFLRCHLPALHEAVGASDPLSTFRTLRTMRDSW